MAKKVLLSSGRCEKQKGIIKRLRAENKSWKETCEILANRTILNDIKVSLRQIRAGKGIPLAEFLSK